MGKKDTHVKHEGTITQIDGTTVYVRIIQHSACAGCHVQSACTAADRSEKIIETTCYIPDLYALLSLLPYYLTLYLFRKKIRKSLVFTVEPLRKNENL